jgi:uncharacterized membrane protein YfcA
MLEKMKTVWIGCLVGFVNGFFGAGGGSVLVPALQRFLRVEVHQAHATAIAVILPLSVVSAVVYVGGAPVDWRALLWVSGGGMAGGFVGAMWLKKFSKKHLHTLFGLFMMGAAVRMMFSDASEAGAAPFPYLYAVAGFAAGVLSGLGVGGGTVLIPALTLLFGMEQRAAQTVNLLYFLPTAAVALVVHGKNGSLRTQGLLTLILAGAAASLAGAWLAGLLAAAWLRKIFGGFLLLMGVMEVRRRKE